MARIADDVIERIKSEVSLIRLAEAQGHSLKKHGKDFILSCPFYNDKTPSLVISPANNLWHCMGACQMGRQGVMKEQENKGSENKRSCAFYNIQAQPIP